MMEMKAKLRCSIVRRKCSQINKTSIKIARKESLKKVSTILRKSESCRSAEEKAVLAKLTDEVKEVKYRLCRKQKIIERSKEVEDDISELKMKCKKLAYAIERAKHLVVYTGAGISTAADIPDYRGPNGIWTLLQQGKKIGKHDLTKADPTSTHMALWQLYRKRYLKFIVSQNCDGLHLRSGLPKRALSEVHGNMYVEICKECKPNLQYWRLFDTTEKTARFYHKTGRICHKCGSPLVDSIVHFGEKGIAQWPLNWAGALHHAAKADVILCLGSSLKVLKKYPWLWAMDKPVKQRPAIFIVNLQWTPKDHIAKLKINGKCDTVMKLIMDYMGLDIPAYERNGDPIFAHCSILSPKELHTTSQPFLVKSNMSNLEIKDSLCLEKSTTGQEMVIEEVREFKETDIDEDEDDCPLKVLKDKMINNDDMADTVLDLTVHETKPDDVCLDTVKTDVKQEHCKEYKNPTLKQECDVENNTIQDDKSRLKVNCTVEVEGDNAANIKDVKNNLKINAIINNRAVTETESNLNGIEEISMEILAEEFERVHVEMKTNENEISQVSILLVNKTPPKKCNKFVQTDPEPLCLDLSKSKGIMEEPSLKYFDTGQFGQNFELQKNLNFRNLLNLGTESVSSHMYINTHIRTEVNTDVGKMISINSQKMINQVNELQSNRSASVNPLRNFRRLKDVKTTLFKQETIFTNTSTTIDMKKEFVKREIEETIEQPLDYSLKIENKQPDIRSSNTSREKMFNPSYILKIPKPPMTYYRHNITEKHFSKNGIIDLRMDRKLGSLISSKCHNFRKPMFINGNTNRDEHFSKEQANHIMNYDILTKLVIENTLKHYHEELQKAYSGLCTIISPVPFDMNYDFDRSFNVSKFMNFAKKLMMKEKLNSTVVRRSKRTTNKNVNKPILSASSKSSRRIRRAQSRFTKKREPSCSFCHENYKSNVCNFYTPQNSDDRFVRYESNKPYFCICCGESESSSESDDDISLMERKKRLQSKTLNSKEEDKTPDEKDDNKPPDSAKNSVASDSIDKEDLCDEKDENVQAGWFGKGFRKNRRRKR